MATESMKLLPSPCRNHYSEYEKDEVEEEEKMEEKRRRVQKKGNELQMSARGEGAHEAQEQMADVKSSSHTSKSWLNLWSTGSGDAARD